MPWRRVCRTTPRRAIRYPRKCGWPSSSFSLSARCARAFWIDVCLPIYTGPAAILQFQRKIFGKGACGRSPGPPFSKRSVREGLSLAGALCYGAGNVRYEEVTGDG